MIQLLILFFVVVFIIAIIMLYKKYIRIKNVVDEELDRKYNNVKKAVGSNNKQIRQLKKDASELINTPNNDTNTLQEKINNNRDKIADNRDEMVKNNFQEINKVFKYESGFIVGGNAGQLRIGSDNIQLNVPNPVQVRVCDEQSCDSDIFTKRNTEDSIPLGINENVDSGVDESKNVCNIDTLTTKDITFTLTSDIEGKRVLMCSHNITGFQIDVGIVGDILYNNFDNYMNKDLFNDVQRDVRVLGYGGEIPPNTPILSIDLLTDDQSNVNSQFRADGKEISIDFQIDDTDTNNCIKFVAV